MLACHSKVHSNRILSLYKCSIYFWHVDLCIWSLQGLGGAEHAGGDDGEEKMFRKYGILCFAVSVLLGGGPCSGLC